MRLCRPFRCHPDEPQRVERTRRATHPHVVEDSGAREASAADGGCVRVRRSASSVPLPAARRRWSRWWRLRARVQPGTGDDLAAVAGENASGPGGRDRPRVDGRIGGAAVVVKGGRLKPRAGIRPRGAREACVRVLSSSRPRGCFSAQTQHPTVADARRASYSPPLDARQSLPRGGRGACSYLAERWAYE